uniref:Uncharacterized protein n=1 Tax=Anguilla anguilla TaxID=7936 RepID=A0A0E9WMF3_ANGAN
MTDMRVWNHKKAGRSTRPATSKQGTAGNQLRWWYTTRGKITRTSLTDIKQNITRNPRNKFHPA